MRGSGVSRIVIVGFIIVALVFSSAFVGTAGLGIRDTLDYTHELRSLLPGPRPGTLATLLSEDFSVPWVLDPDGDYLAPPGWDVDGNDYWSQFNDGASGLPISNSTPYSAGIWWSPINPQDARLISPELNLSTSMNTKLYFNSIYTMPSYGAGPGARDLIEVSTDEGASWTILADLAHDLQFEIPGATGGPGGPGWCWYEMWNAGQTWGPVDLSAYDSMPSVTICFHYDIANTSERRGIWCIDDVRVVAFPIFDISLTTGWNLISIPFDMADNSVENVLASISGSWDAVKYYNPIDTTDPWKTYRVAGTANDLTDLDCTIGFWIHTTENCTLAVFGTVPTPTSITLYAGWNLVGYPSQTEMSVGNALWGTDPDRVEVFDAGSPSLISEVGPTYMMKPGEGYWVHVPADTIWTINW